MNYLLKLKKKMDGYPLGKKMFSYAVARKAPYFLTIKPSIDRLEHNYIEVSMKKRKAVHNHIGTVHAIACCNLCEFAAGICMEASIPKHRRWIPAGMDVKYLKKASTDLTASCDLSEIDWDRCDHALCKVSVKDLSGNVVVYAEINMKVSDKKK